MSTTFRPYSESEALRSDRSAGDRKRHREKLRRSIRENIADVIAEESIIGRDRDRVIKVPIRGVKEYRFVYRRQCRRRRHRRRQHRARAGRGLGPWQGRSRPGTGRQRSGPRLLRDRDHARRADRHHVRGSRAAGSGAQDPQAGHGRANRQAAGLSQGRHPGPPRPAPHHQGEAAPQDRGRRAADDAGRRARGRSERPPEVPVPQGGSDLQTPGAGRARGKQRGRHLHHGHLGLDGSAEEIPGPQLLLPAVSSSSAPNTKRSRSSSSPTTRRPKRSPRKNSSTRANRAAR